MSRFLAILFFSFSLTGCLTTHPTIPDNYKGPTATIQDSAVQLDTGAANMFVLTHVDGKQIDSSFFKTNSASYGTGNYLNTIVLNHTVPAKPVTLTLSGTTVYAMPIRALTNRIYSVEGDVTFTPGTNKRYLIDGKLGADGSSIWIKDIDTGEIVAKVQN